MSNNIDHIYISSVSRSGSTLVGELCADFNGFQHVGELMYWSSQRIEQLCTCGKSECRILDRLRDLGIGQYAGVLLKIWYLYEKRFFGDNLNPELMPNEQIIEGWNNDDLLDAYEAMIKILADIYGLGSTFVDNTKNIDCVDALLKRKKTKIVILLRDPRGIMYSYLKSRLRKAHLPCSPGGKIKELEYFGAKAIHLSKNEENIVVLKYEDIINNPSLIGEKILGLPGDRHTNGTTDKHSHLIRGNHFMYGDAYKALGRLSLQLKMDDEWAGENDGIHQKLVLQNQNLIAIYRQLGYFG